MELKAVLNKPYTKKEKLDFKTQYQYDCKIVETSLALEAWGLSYAETLQKVKEEKAKVALDEANKYQQQGSVEYKNCVFEMSDSNRKNLSDTEEALVKMGMEETMWLDRDDHFVTLTIEDIQYIRLNLILAEVQKLWISKYPYFLQQINAAQTLEEVDAIQIDYTQEVPNEEEPEVQEGNEE